MTSYTNDTHDPALTSWVTSANAAGTDFPIQNLPFGVYTRKGRMPRGGDGYWDNPQNPIWRNDESDPPAVGVAIGDMILDVTAAFDAEALKMNAEAEALLASDRLDDFLTADPKLWAHARTAISRFLRSDNTKVAEDKELVELILVPQRDVIMHRPVEHIGDYTDFYASIHHATNVGSMFRPDNPLLPNYKHLPVGYHGRASSLVVSGTKVRRPMGQTVATDGAEPTFGPCKLLDYEMEMGFFVGQGNALGTRIPMSEASQHIFGMVIVNDWSARDIQKWEYVPLGPFNAKNFATTISPWVVTLEALAPFRVPGPPRGEGDPEVLDYLKPAEDMGLDITVEVWIASQKMRDAKTQAMLVSRGSFAEMYWTIAQMLAHHTSTGCNMQPGDLLATGTISGPTEDSRGSLLERTWRGTQPFKLPDGTERKFLQDGDEVIMKAYCDAAGKKRIGFGECRGIVLPAE